PFERADTRGRVTDRTAESGIAIASLLATFAGGRRAGNRGRVRGSRDRGSRSGTGSMDREVGTVPTGATATQGSRGHVPPPGEPDFRIETRGTLEVDAPAAWRTASDSDQGELRELLGIAFESFPLGAIVVGLDGRLLHVNPAICTMLGRSA